MTDIMELFEINTETKKKDGLWDVSCRKGFWGVSAVDKERAIKEAMYYFIQYLEDGEYD